MEGNSWKFLTPNSSRPIAAELLNGPRFRPLLARYDRRLGRIVISFASGLQLAFPPRAVEGLQTALPDDFAEAEVSPSGLGVHFPRLDADIYLPALLEGFFGAGQPAGSHIGKAGAKTIAASENGEIG